MQELVDLVKSSSSIDDRTRALEELEEMVESLDNANDLEPLGLWEPLISFLGDQESKIRFHTAWVLGTAIQNNEKSQQSFFKNDGINAISRLLIDSDVNVISKSLYCISGLINHYPDALTKFIDLNGFKKLASVLAMGDLNCCRKVLFMMSSLLSNDNPLMTHKAALDSNLGGMIVTLLESPDVDVIEKALVVLEIWESTYPGTIKDFFVTDSDFVTIKGDQELYQRFLKFKSNLI